LLCKQCAVMSLESWATNKTRVCECTHCRLSCNLFIISWPVTKCLSCTGSDWRRPRFSEHRRLVFSSVVRQGCLQWVTASYSTVDTVHRREKIGHELNQNKFTFAVKERSYQSSHLTSSRLTFHLNWVAVSALWRDSIRRNCHQSEKTARPTLFWLVTAAANRVSNSALAATQFRWNEVSWDEVRWDEMNYMNAS